MPFEIVRHDITQMEVDAIVNAANNRLAEGGGVCGAIHRAAGPELAKECEALGGCATGDAKITRGYRLKCRYVIHAVGPVWQGGDHGEKELLTSCYQRSLALAAAHGLNSIAFPLISAGIYGYPKEQALRVAMDAIRDFLMSSDSDLLVYLVVFDPDSFRISGKLYRGIAEYIDDHYAHAHTDASRRLLGWEDMSAEAAASMPDHMPRASNPSAAPKASRRLLAPVWRKTQAAPSTARSLEDALEMIDESFSEMVLRLIDEKGMTDPECYKKANLDRKLFSKLRTDKGYKPRKQTALALAIALELSLSETKELLMKAGFALSHSDKADIIVEYFIRQRQYDIFEINAALYSFDQVPLGGRAS